MNIHESKMIYENNSNSSSIKKEKKIIGDIHREMGLNHFLKSVSFHPFLYNTQVQKTTIFTVQFHQLLY